MMDQTEKHAILTEEAIQEKILKLCNAQTSDEVIAFLQDGDITPSIMFEAISKGPKELYRLLPNNYKTTQNTFIACNADLANFKYIPDGMFVDKDFNNVLKGLLYKDCGFSLKDVPSSYQTALTIGTILKYEPTAITSVDLHNYKASDILRWLCVPGFHTWLENNPHNYTNIDTLPQSNILETITTIVHQHYPNIYYALQLGVRNEELNNLIKLTLENKVILSTELTNDLPEIT